MIFYTQTSSIEDLWQTIILSLNLFVYMLSYHKLFSISFMKISIIGAGFAGLATAWHLLNKIKNLDLTLIDEVGFGAGASGVSVGLMHSFVGFTGKKNPEGDFAYASSLALLEISAKELAMPVYAKKGLLRFPVNASQEKSFKASVDLHANAHWLDIEACQKLAPGSIASPGMFIEDALTVEPLKYLQGLFLACKKLGMKYKQEKVLDLSDISKENDQVIVTAGAGVFAFEKACNDSLRLLKGQTLTFPWPENCKPLDTVISSNVYITIDAGKKLCHVGSTFEREFERPGPDMERACLSILPALDMLFPPLKGVKPIDCKAGFRVTTSNHVPLIEKVDEKIYVYTGLGSKGLLYHSLYAEKLIELLYS